MSELSKEKAIWLSQQRRYLPRRKIDLDEETSITLQSGAPRRANARVVVNFRFVLSDVRYHRSDDLPESRVRESTER